jgi:hypothetical protein
MTKSLFLPKFILLAAIPWQRACGASRGSEHSVCDDHRSQTEAKPLMLQNSCDGHKDAKSRSQPAPNSAEGDNARLHPSSQRHASSPLAESTTHPPAPTSNLALATLNALRICREVYIDADKPLAKTKILATKGTLHSTVRLLLVSATS